MNTPLSADAVLLQLAAKTMGYSGYIDYPFGQLAFIVPDAENPIMWKPFDHDGDAFRLAVQSGVIQGSMMTAMCAVHQAPDDIYARYRRAVVLAAAEIGKSL